MSEFDIWVRLLTMWTALWLGLYVLVSIAVIVQQLLKKP